MPATVSFYHLRYTPLEKVLPKLLEKITQSNMRSVVIFDSDETVVQFNKILWIYSTLAFLPHGSKFESSDIIEDLPIWLSSTIENPNNSTVCIITGNHIIPNNPELLNFDRIVYIFDATVKSELKLFHERTQHHQQQNHEIVSWYQTKTGWSKDQNVDAPPL